MVIVDILTYMLEHVGVYHGIYRTCIQCVYIYIYYKILYTCLTL